MSIRIIFSLNKFSRILIIILSIIKKFSFENHKLNNCIKDKIDSIVETKNANKFNTFVNNTEIYQDFKIFEDNQNNLFAEFQKLNQEFLRLSEIINEIENNKILKLKNEEKKIEINNNILSKNSFQENSTIENIYFSNFEVSQLKNSYENFNRKKIYKFIDNDQEINNIKISQNLENIYFNKKEKYDINNRFNLHDIFINIDKKPKKYYKQFNFSFANHSIFDDIENSFHSDDLISFFEIFNYKSIAKNENGLIQNQMILIAKNNSLFAYDIFLNLIGSAIFQDKILLIKTFKNQDDGYIFILFESFKTNEKIYILKKLKISFEIPQRNPKYFKYFNLSDKNENISKSTSEKINKKEKIYNNKHYDSEVSSNYDNDDVSNNESDEDNEKVTVRNFKENLSTYSISKYYKQQIKKNKIVFNLENEIILKNQEIINFKLHISKSIKYLAIISRDNKNSEQDLKNNRLGKKIKINYFDDQLNKFKKFYLNENNSEKNKKKYISNFKDFQFFFNFAYLKYDDSIKISTIENLDSFILKCNLEKHLIKESKNNNDNIYKNYVYTYDQLNNFLLILTEDLEFLIFYPIVKSTNPQNKNLNLCNFKKSFKSKDFKYLLKLNTSDEDFININVDYINLEIIRNDLIINFNKIGKILFINLEKFEENIENDFFDFRIVDTYKYQESNKFQFFNFSPFKIISNKNSGKNSFKENTQEISTNFKISDFIYCKNTFSNFILIQSYDNPNLIMIFELYNPHSKLVGGDLSFLNFKIPIIFIAMIILFFYHYSVKKKEILETSTPAMKKEIFKYLEDQGAFKKNYKEENDKIKSVESEKYKNFKIENEEIDSNADESVNDSVDEIDSEHINSEKFCKEKIIQFIKNKK